MISDSIIRNIGFGTNYFKKWQSHHQAHQQQPFSLARLSLAHRNNLSDAQSGQIISWRKVNLWLLSSVEIILSLVIFNFIFSCDCYHSSWLQTSRFYYQHVVLYVIVVLFCSVFVYFIFLYYYFIVFFGYWCMFLHDFVLYWGDFAYADPYVKFMLGHLEKIGW